MYMYVYVCICMYMYVCTYIYILRRSLAVDQSEVIWINPIFGQKWISPLLWEVNRYEKITFCKRAKSDGEDENMRKCKQHVWLENQHLELRRKDSFANQRCSIAVFVY